ncbi:MAG: hypothetical protein OXL68_01240 [Paracoccaceae bacterium]|nr:hypothetical protein [Paracoccaceae bacterium]
MPAFVAREFLESAVKRVMWISEMVRHAKPAFQLPNLLGIKKTRNDMVVL